MEHLWIEGSAADWERALSLYDRYVTDPDLEHQMETLEPDIVRNMSAQQFYEFLHDRYFVWKYNDPRRLVTSRRHLERYSVEGLGKLSQIQQLIFYAYELGPDNSEVLLIVTSLVYGLGTAGASGLLSLLFPSRYGTVDQRVVYALNGVNSLPEHDRIESMEKHADELSVNDGVFLEDIMRRKSEELNHRFHTDEWTPRKVDKVLYTMGRLLSDRENTGES